MLYRAKMNRSTWLDPAQQDALRKMHRHLAWALGVATIALIINAVAVVALFEAG